MKDLNKDFIVNKLASLDIDNPSAELQLEFIKSIAKAAGCSVCQKSWEHWSGRHQSIYGLYEISAPVLPPIATFNITGDGDVEWPCPEQEDE